MKFIIYNFCLYSWQTNPYQSYCDKTSLTSILLGVWVLEEPLNPTIVFFSECVLLSWSQPYGSSKEKVNSLYHVYIVMSLY